MTEAVPREWDGIPCFVCAPGPSLTEDVVKRIRYTRLFSDCRVLLVGDSYRIMPWADAMYACDPKWWKHHKTCNGFVGHKWATHEPPGHNNDEAAKEWGVRLVSGKHQPGYSTDQSLIHYGNNGGHQAINLAILLGSPLIVLAGFDMDKPNGKAHFFGEHPKEVGRSGDYAKFAKHFKQPPEGVEILNTTLTSKLDAYPKVELEEAIARLSSKKVRRDSDHLRDRPEYHPGPDSVGECVAG